MAQAMVLGGFGSRVWGSGAFARDRHDGHERQPLAISAWMSAEEVANLLLRGEFLDALRKAIAQNIVRRFGGERSDLVILRGQIVSNGDIIVLTRVKSETSGIVPVDWRVRRLDSDLFVVDLSVNGSSIAVARREEYHAWLTTHGGPITGLIPLMEAPHIEPQK